jgi:hypothetical protein
MLAGKNDFERRVTQWRQREPLALTVARGFASFEHAPVSGGLRAARDWSEPWRGLSSR